MEIITFNRGEIDVSELKKNSKKLREGIIAPAEQHVEYEIAKDHAAEPIKSMEDIDRISKYFIENKQYRNNMLFIVGINFGLRISDLRVLRFSNLINDNFTFKDKFPVFEQKTRNTRKRKKNRYITINDAVIEAVTLYLENTPNVCLSNFLFRSERSEREGADVPITARAVEYILKDVVKELGLNIHVATHTLRKTFGYHQMMMGGNDPRRLLLLQKMFNHASPAQTLDYIGITEEEIEAAYKGLNLGSDKNYLKGSEILEFDDRYAINE